MPTGHLRLRSEPVPLHSPLFFFAGNRTKGHDFSDPLNGYEDHIPKHLTAFAAIPVDIVASGAKVAMEILPFEAIPPITLRRKKPPAN